MSWKDVFPKIKEFSIGVVRDYTIGLFCKKDKYERCIRDLVLRTSSDDVLVGVTRIDVIETADSFTVVLVRESSIVTDDKQ